MQVISPLQHDTIILTFLTFFVKGKTQERDFLPALKGEVSIPKILMKPSDRTHTDSREAKQIWEEYQKQHNLSDRIGQTVGIDPMSKQIWFGTSIQDIVLQRNSEGLDSPLFFERVGSETYLRKGGHR